MGDHTVLKHMVATIIIAISIVGCTDGDSQTPASGKTAAKKGPQIAGPTFDMQLASIVPSPFQELNAAQLELGRAKCVVKMRNLHMACVEYADKHGVYPGAGAAEPGVTGIRDLVREGYLVQMKHLICPVSQDSLKAYGDLLLNGSVKPGNEEKVADLIQLGNPVGSCSYLFTNRTITATQDGGALLCVDAKHGVSGAPQFSGTNTDNHKDGVNTLTNDGAISFRKLRTKADVEKIRKQLTADKKQ